MKRLFYLAAISVVISEAADPHLIFLRALARSDIGISRLDSSSSDTARCESGKTRECASCSTSRICLPNGAPIATLNCSSYSPSTPFCNPENGLCVAQQPATCGGSGSSFPCPSEDGIYPDPNDCAQFHYCVNGEDVPIVCPANNVYDHELGTCKLRKKLSDCVKFDCVRKEGEDILYPKDDRIWATCAGGKAYIMGRCKDYERYNVPAKKCSRVCRVVENQPIEDSCDRYIRCADVGAGNILPYEFPCPPGKGFDKVKKICSSDVVCPDKNAPDDHASAENSTEESTSNESTGNDDRTEETGEGNNSPLSRINNSGNQNSGNNVENGDDEVNGNLVNGNGNEKNSNSGNIGSGNRDERLSPRIINNSGDNNANNSVKNGNDDVSGNLINGNNNGNNANSGNRGIRAPVSRINNSGNNNSGNNVANGDDETNGNLVNGNDNSGNSNVGNIGSGNQGGFVSRIINNSGNDNSGNDLRNGNDSVDGNLINGNNNGNNLNSGNRGGFASRINNSGNDNANNNVSNGDDKTNGNLVNGNENSGNSNSGNVGSGNRRRRSLAPRIINSSGDGNSGNDIANGNDNVEGNVINGNNNNNNDNSDNSVGKEDGDKPALTLPTDDGSSPDQLPANFEQSEAGENEKAQNLAEAIENLIEWLKNKITDRLKSGDESSEVDSAEEDTSSPNNPEH